VGPEATLPDPADGYTFPRAAILSSRNGDCLVDMNLIALDSTLSE